MTRDVLAAEFSSLPPQVIERVTAAARHALERTGRPVQPADVERLARERLRAKIASGPPR